MPDNNHSLRAFAQFAIAAVLVYGAYLIFQPFLLPVVSAAIIALVSRPMYRSLKPHFSSDTSTALTCLLIVILVVMVPAGLLSLVLLREVGSLSGSINHNNFDFSHLDLIANKFAAGFGINGIHVDLRAYTLDALGKIAGHSSAILGGVFGVLGDTVLILFGLFYLLQSSGRMRGYLRELSPLRSADTDMVIDRAEQVIQATVRGNVLLVALQGICFVIGCLVFGFKAPLILGILYGLTSMVPVIGSSIIWGPMLIISLLSGHQFAGIGIAIWALVQILVIDHIIGPRLIGARTKLNPYLALLGILGGISQFGLLGFILGPTVVALGVVGLELLGRSWQRQ